MTVADDTISGSSRAPAAATPSQTLTERKGPRPIRSKNGCLTCKRRKVRCDEHRPRCSHCERLNLQCMWRPAYAPPSSLKFVAQQPGGGGGATSKTTATPRSSSPGLSAPVAQTPDMTTGFDHSWLQSPGGVDQMFDYASFMWNPGSDGLGQRSPELVQSSLTLGNLWNNRWPGMENNQARPTTKSACDLPLEQTQGPPNPLGGSSGLPDRPNRPVQADSIPAVEEHTLLNYFVHTVVPPILAEVETQKRWATMRQMLISMSNGSTMVRSAILAFSSLLYYRRDLPWAACPQLHYDMATHELLALGDLASAASHTSMREHLLATLFFLSYADILEDRVASAHDHLKRAYMIFQQGKKSNRFRPVEIRILSWIRLLDAKAVSAGGEGLFLSDKSEEFILQPSPASVEDHNNDLDGSITGSRDEVKDWDIEDVLFQVLYQPGIVFFQKVESFMGRISMIDPWHRSRGTVEDETEVMQIASQITKDLAQLYEDRPTLMDHAVEGSLRAPHVSESLAIPITRAFRTYLSNYHASKVHLHRVAYKHLPLSRGATEGLREIRRLTRMLSDDLEPDAALPVSQLWPLLMLGVEEEDPSEREWIKQSILRMEKVATNARVTAQVLEEVQARQDASKARVDIRSVMHAIFDSCFAIM